MPWAVQVAGEHGAYRTVFTADRFYQASLHYGAAFTKYGGVRKRLLLTRGDATVVISRERM